jgi:hypothetical protein
MKYDRRILYGMCHAIQEAVDMGKSSILKAQLKDNTCITIECSVKPDHLPYKKRCDGKSVDISVTVCTSCGRKTRRNQTLVVEQDAIMQKAQIVLNQVSCDVYDRLTFLDVVKYV